MGDYGFEINYNDNNDGTVNAINTDPNRDADAYMDCEIPEYISNEDDCQVVYSVPFGTEVEAPEVNEPLYEEILDSVPVIPVSISEKAYIERIPVDIVGEGKYNLIPAEKKDPEDTSEAIFVPAEDIVPVQSRVEGGSIQAKGYALRVHGGTIRALGYRTGDGRMALAGCGIKGFFKTVGNVGKKAVGVVGDAVGTAAKVATNVVGNAAKNFVDSGIPQQVVKTAVNGVVDAVVDNPVVSGVVNTGKNVIKAISGGTLEGKMLAPSFNTFYNAYGGAMRVYGLGFSGAGDPKKGRTTANSAKSGEYSKSTQDLFDKVKTRSSSSSPSDDDDDDDDDDLFKSSSSSSSSSSSKLKKIKKTKKEEEDVRKMSQEEEDLANEIMKEQLAKNAQKLFGIAWDAVKKTLGTAFKLAWNYGGYIALMEKGLTLGGLEEYTIGYKVDSLMFKKDIAQNVTDIVETVCNCTENAVAQNPYDFRSLTYEQFKALPVPDKMHSLVDEVGRRYVTRYGEANFNTPEYNALFKFNEVLYETLTLAQDGFEHGRKLEGDTEEDHLRRSLTTGQYRFRMDSDLSPDEDREFSTRYSPPSATNMKQYFENKPGLYESHRRAAKANDWKFEDQGFKHKKIGNGLFGGNGEGDGNEGEGESNNYEAMVVPYGQEYPVRFIDNPEDVREEDFIISKSQSASFRHVIVETRKKITKFLRDKIPSRFERIIFDWHVGSIVSGAFAFVAPVMKLARPIMDAADMLLARYKDNIKYGALAVLKSIEWSDIGAILMGLSAIWGILCLVRYFITPSIQLSTTTQCDEVLRKMGEMEGDINTIKKIFSIVDNIIRTDKEMADSMNSLHPSHRRPLEYILYGIGIITARIDDISGKLNDDYVIMEKNMLQWEMEVEKYENEHRTITRGEYNSLKQEGKDLLDSRYRRGRTSMIKTMFNQRKLNGKRRTNPVEKSSLTEGDKKKLEQAINKGDIQVQGARTEPSPPPSMTKEQFDDFLSSVVTRCLRENDENITSSEMVELMKSGRTASDIKRIFGKKLKEKRKEISSRLIMLQDNNESGHTTRSNSRADVVFNPIHHDITGQFGDWGYFRDKKDKTVYRTNYLTGETQKVGGMFLNKGRGFAVNGVQYEPLYRAAGWKIPPHIKYKRNKILFGGKEPQITPEERRLFEKYRSKPELFRKIYANNRNKLIKFYHYIH